MVRHLVPSVGGNDALGCLSALQGARANVLEALDLREHLTDASDYSVRSPIEPSDTGGRKIARALLDGSQS